MKLNYKRTIFVGFAFFLICTFWQAYDSVIPKILTDKFGMSQAGSGIIMALDNILALFMLPLFGTLSDKSKSRFGRRTPFIVVGTIVAVLAFIGLSFVDMAQLKNITEVSTVDDPAALELLYEHDYQEELMTPSGEVYTLADRFTEEEFTAITSKVDGQANADYTDFVVPARQAYVHEITKANPGTLILFIAVLLIVLISMATFRSPAVALMPDVTMKPLRSKANAIINLMGTLGGVCVLALGMVFKTGAAVNAMMSYTVFFGIVGGIMLVALAVFLWQVREPKFVAEMEQDSIKYGIDESVDDSGKGSRKLSRAELRSLLLILASVMLWFFGYNAVTSKYSVYAGNVLNLDFNTTLIIAQIAAVIAYLPVGFVASKIGRKKCILAGIVMLTAAFVTASFLRAGSSVMVMNCMFALAGIGWATINVNSFPMVVELAKGGDVGKFTGFYYTASMAAQTLTPYASGLLMDKMGMTVLFPYASVFVGLAFITMLFVMHGDSKPTAAKIKAKA